MKHKLGTFFMILGAVLVVAALSLFLWNRREASEAGEAAQEVLPRLVAAARQQQTVSDETTALPDPYDPEMTVVEINGYGYVGYLSIPALELELPVMAECDETRLKIAPCRYAGSTKTDDLVIAGHNYTTHFGPLANLSAGDQVYFTDMDGVVSRYTVVAMDVLAPNAVEEMTSADYELTLFTCTYGGQNRVTVRCLRDSQ